MFGFCQQTQDDSLKNTALSGPILTDEKVDVFVRGPGELSVTHEVLDTDLLDNSADRGVLFFSNLEKELEVNIGCLVTLKLIILHTLDLPFLVLDGLRALFKFFLLMMFQ